MIKVGNVVEYYGNVGTVRRVLSDDNGSMAMVQWIGSSDLNLKPVDTRLLSLSTNERLITEASIIILKTIVEISRHPELNKISLFEDVYEEVEGLFDAWKIPYDN